MVRFFNPALMPGIPGFNAVIQALFHLGPQAPQPFRVTAHAPFAADFHDAPQLAVRGGVKIGHHRPDRNGATESLMPRVALRRAELGFAQGSLQFGKQVRNGLGIVPHVRARAMTATGIIAAAFPGPEPSIGLAQNRGGFQDGQVRRHGFDHFGGQGGIVKTIAEPPGITSQARVIIGPMRGQLANPGE